MYSCNLFYIFKTKAKANTELQVLENQLEEMRFKNQLTQKDESLEGKIKDLVAEIGNIIKQNETGQMSGQGSKG